MINSAKKVRFVVLASRQVNATCKHEVLTLVIPAVMGVPKKYYRYALKIKSVSFSHKQTSRGTQSMWLIDCKKVDL